MPLLNRWKRQGLAAFALLVSGAAAPCNAAEPQVAFTLKKGWVGFAIEQDGKPVPSAIVRAFDEHGHNFAEGETGDEGRGEVPQPRGASFTIEIKVGKRVADPIRIRRAGKGVEPANVLLSFGLRPCCRVPSQGWSFKPPEPMPSGPRNPRLWLQAGAGTVFLMFGAAILILARRPSPTDTDLPPGGAS